MNVSLQGKVGQKLIVGLKGTQIDEDFIQLIKVVKAGSVILFSHNMHNEAQTAVLCSDIQALIQKETGFPAFIMTDQEGGTVSRLPEDMPQLCGAMAVAAAGPPKQAYQTGTMTGELLKHLGINFNLAPVLDINSNADNPVIGVRSYGDRPEQVAEYAIQMMKGLKNGGVLACGKHFPGHGDTDVDSHLGLPSVSQTVEALMKNELLPFRQAIEEGLPAVMTAHILFPQLEEEKIPATMSRAIVTGLLKDTLGFQGLVLSDCMEMNAIKDFYGMEAGVVGAVMAGVDLVCISHTAEYAKRASAALMQAVKNGKISEQEVDKSLEKIVNLKYGVCAERGRKLSKEAIAKIGTAGKELLKKSITYIHPDNDFPILGQRPLFASCNAFRSTPASSTPLVFNFAEYMRSIFANELPECEAAVVTARPTGQEIEQLAAKAGAYSSIVIGTYNGHLRKEQITLVNRLCGVHDTVIAVALRNPYDLSEISNKAFKIAAFEYSKQCFEVLAELFRKHGGFTGVMPVSLRSLTQ